MLHEHIDIGAHYSLARQLQTTMMMMMIAVRTVVTWNVFSLCSSRVSTCVVQQNAYLHVKFMKLLGCVAGKQELTSHTSNTDPSSQHGECAAALVVYILHLPRARCVYFSSPSFSFAARFFKLTFIVIGAGKIGA